MQRQQSSTVNQATTFICHEKKITKHKKAMDLCKVIHHMFLHHTKSKNPSIKE